jgi:hypothetical protein
MTKVHCGVVLYLWFVLLQISQPYIFIVCEETTKLYPSKGGLNNLKPFHVYLFSPILEV